MSGIKKPLRTNGGRREPPGRIFLFLAFMIRGSILAQCECGRRNNTFAHETWLKPKEASFPTYYRRKR